LQLFDRGLEMQKAHRFLGRPSRGGMLTIVNCLLWAVVLIGILIKENLLLLPALVACWPLAWVFILPTLDGSSSTELVAACIMIGVNSFLWGYGISWLASLVGRITQRSGPQRAPRGFDVIVHDKVSESPIVTRPKP
jgi:hypothetical protein